MNDVPTPPGTEPGGQQYAGQPPAEDPVAAADQKRKKQLWILSGVAAVLIIAALFAGKALGENDYKKGSKGYEAIYNEGYKAGQATGYAVGDKAGEKAGYRSGDKAGEKSGYRAGDKAGEKSGYQSGDKAGLKQGEAEGLAKGTELGKQEGEAQGTREGAAAALGNLSYSTGQYYIVTMQQGSSSGVPFVVKKRTTMEPGILYKICSSGQGLCSTPGS